MALSCMRCPAAAAGGGAVLRRAAGPPPPASASVAFSFARCGGRSAAAAAGWRIDAVAGKGVKSPMDTGVENAATTSAPPKVENGTPSAITVEEFEDLAALSKDGEASVSITVVGASGDLAKKKIFPALFALYYEDCLPKHFSIFGYARSKMTDAELRDMVSKTLTCRIDKRENCSEKMEEFLKRCFYHSGQYDSETDFMELGKKIKEHEILQTSPEQRRKLQERPSGPRRQGRRTRRCAGAPPHHLPSGLGTGGSPVRAGSRHSSDPEILHLATPEASKQQTTSARNFSWAGTAATRSPATGNSHHNSEDLRPRDERTAGDDAPQSITTEEESRRSKSPLRPRRHLPDAAGWNLRNPTLQTEEKRGSLALPPPERPAEDEGPSESTALRWIGRWIPEIAPAVTVARGKGPRVSNHLFYLSIPPNIFLDVVKCASRSASSENGWTRVIVEKPFGRDSESSAALTRGLKQYLVEDQIFRIDHYLGKELVENLSVLRFSNLVFEPLWSRQYIRNVQLIFSEDFGTEGRGGYFDSYGIIRDIMQNHLLQILALFAMETPISLEAEDIRNEKVKVLRSMKPLQLEDVVVGQYKSHTKGCITYPGYTDDKTVPKGSLAPTFAAAALFINNARWDGVPFLMKAGKALHTKQAEIRVQFRHVPGNLYKGAFGTNLDRATNELVIRVQPDEGIYLKINNKIPGLGMRLDRSNLNLHYAARYPKEIPDAYERLLLDAIEGERRLFIRSDELDAAWELFTPLLKELEQKRTAPELYPYGSRGPVGAHYLAAKYNVRWGDLSSED